MKKIASLENAFGTVWEKNPKILLVTGTRKLLRSFYKSLIRRARSGTAFEIPVPDSLQLYAELLICTPIFHETSHSRLFSLPLLMIIFGGTAYENPGVQLPESIITWVAIRGMPEYMNNLR